MKAFTPIDSIAAPLLADNVDTDTIIPSREMRSTGRTGLADGLFAPWRYTEGRIPNPDFVLNQPAYSSAQVLAAGANFGCGSSREHAVWALAEWGIRAILAPGFAPIFEANCLANGLLPVTLSAPTVAALAGQRVRIDLAAGTVTCVGQVHPFAIDPEARIMLLEGLDVIDLTLKSETAIAAFLAADRAARPWVYLESRP